MEGGVRSLRNIVLARFHRVDTWLIIALLALSGWTFDALRMFLQMHETPLAGLRAFASHFWYVIPVMIAIIVLTRLRPKARLLGQATYDEVGHLVAQQGDFRLDELTAKGMLATMRSDSRLGLHCFILPSGANVYFVRDGPVTLMLCFSGLASHKEVTSQAERSRAGLGPTFDLLEGLEPPMRALATNVATSPLKRDVLAYLYRYGRTSIQAADLAHWVSAGEPEVVEALAALAELGLVERTQTCGLTFYHLRNDPKVRQDVNQLNSWLSEWQVALNRLERAVGRG